MPRSLLLPATTLAALTALALVAAAMAIRPPPPVALGSPADGANRAAVQRFYAAVNATIATGETAPLAAVLAPDYADRAADGTATPGREALEQYLVALHVVTPDLRLEPEALVADGDRVVALVRAHGGDAVSFLGLALDGPPAWGPVDVFRFADGRVAERRGTGERHALLEPLATFPLDVSPPAERVVTAQRVLLPPGGWRRAPAVDGLRVLYLETGALAVEVESTVEPPPTTRELAAGSGMVVSDGAAYAVRNGGEEPAVLLEVLAAEVALIQSNCDAQGGAARECAVAPVAEGATTQVLAGGQKVAVAPGPAALAVGRATLAPGARLAWPSSPGPVLLVVEAGALGLARDGEQSAWVRIATDGQAHYRGQATLGAGDGALVGAWIGAEVRNAGEGPLEILVVTLIASTANP